MQGSKGEPEHIKAKPIRAVNNKKTSKRETWAKVCFYYPQYTLEQASQLSLRDIKLLLRMADKIEAERYHNLVQITSAPHTEKGKGVKDLLTHYQQIMEK